MRSLSNFFLICGLSLFCLGLALVFKRIKFYRNSKLATGRIVGYERHRTEFLSHHPVVEFTDSKNRRIEFKSNVASNNKRYEIGDRVPVRYLSSNPQTAEINKSWVIWFDVPLCFIFSIVLLWLGAR